MTLSLLKNKIFKNQKKLIIILVIVFGLVLVSIKIFSTNVSANIVPILVHEEELAFGTVFPGEELEGKFGVHFVTEYEEEGITYKIIFKRKPLPAGYPGTGDPDMPGYYRDLCPFLTPVNVDPGETDTKDLAYVGDDDLSDDWIIYFKVPAIMGTVAQEHVGGVVTTDGDYGCDVSIDIPETP
jgi:hypothetical protein